MNFTESLWRVFDFLFPLFLLNPWVVLVVYNFRLCVSCYSVIFKVCGYEEMDVAVISFYFRQIFSSFFSLLFYEKGNYKLSSGSINLLNYKPLKISLRTVDHLGFIHIRMRRMSVPHPVESPIPVFDTPDFPYQVKGLRVNVDVFS